MPEPHTLIKSTSSANTSNYRADIDGLRALAVLSVVGFHAFPNSVRGGFIGVDIFFVISGYLITGIILSSLQKNSFSFVDFYRRRIKRIFPALTLVLATCFLIGWLTLLPSELKNLGKHMAGGAIFISNFLLWQESGYFDQAADTKPLLHLWSLAIEEQFYIVWPVALWVLRDRLKGCVILITIVLIFSFCLNILNINSEPTATFYSPLTRFWELSIGALLATISLRADSKSAAFDRSALLQNCLAFLGLVSLLLGIMFISKAAPFPGAWALLPTLGCGLLIAATDRAWINRVILGSKPLVWIGLISYPLYLWHWPLLSFARIIAGQTPPVSIRILAVVLSVLLAWLTFRIIEKPIRHSPSKKPLALILVLLMSGLGAIGYYTFHKNGLIRLNSSAEVLPQALEQASDFSSNSVCHARYPQFKGEYCYQSRPGSPDIQVLGDSHANRLISGLSQFTNQNILQLSHGGCPQFFGLASHVLPGADVCSKLTQQALTVALSTPSIKTVIIKFRGALYIGSHGGAVSLTTTPPIRNVHDAFRISMRKTFDELRAAHKNIVFVFDNPEIDFDPKACVEIRPSAVARLSSRDVCAIPRTQFEAHQREYRALMNSILRDYPEIKIADSAADLCDDTYCYAMKDGQLLYTDSNHLSPNGSTLVSRRIGELVP